MVFWIIGGFSLEVIWGRSPLKFRLNNFEDPAVAGADIFNYSMSKCATDLSCVCTECSYMLSNKINMMSGAWCTAMPKPQWCYILCMRERIVRSTIISIGVLNDTHAQQLASL